MNERMVRVMHAICDKCGAEQEFVQNAIPARALERDGLTHGGGCNGTARFTSEPYIPENEPERFDEVPPLERW